MAPLALLASVSANPLSLGIRTDVYYLLIDLSSSMNEIPRVPAVPVNWSRSKIAEVKTQVATLCRALPNESAVRVLVFSEGDPLEGPRFDLLGPRERADLEKYFASMEAQGLRTYAWRALDYSLSAASRELMTSQRAAQIRVLFFTDGEDNDPARPRLEDVLARYTSLLIESDGRVHIDYLTLGFTLAAEVQHTFGKMGVTARATVRPEEILPVRADFSWSGEYPEEGELVQFIDRSLGLIVKHSWNFGVGTTSTEKAPVWRFPRAGKFNITLEVEALDGRRDRMERMAEVRPRKPVVALFEWFPMEVFPEQTILFRNLCDGPVSEYEWSFGDGSNSHEHEPTHTYSASGVYAVILTARSKDGATATTNFVRILPIPAPKAMFVVGSEMPIVKQPVRFVNKSTGNISEAVWRFSDTAEIFAENDTVIHTFSKAGVYKVTLEISGPGGRDEFTTEVQVGVPSPPVAVPPVANFELSGTRGVAPFTVKIVNRSAGTIGLTCTWRMAFWTR